MDRRTYQNILQVVTFVFDVINVLFRTTQLFSFNTIYIILPCSAMLESSASSCSSSQENSSLSISIFSLLNRNKILVIKRYS